jgi:hypothetical protein
MIVVVSEVDDGIKLAAETSGAVVKALAEESGALAPVKAYGDYIAASIHLRHDPNLVARAMAAAEKIQRSGLPRRAFAEVPDPLLRAILMNAAEEDEPTMQERWENLLSNAVTSGSADVKRAFPNVLSELEPAEAAQLEKYADETSADTLDTKTFPAADADVGLGGLDNLVRLGLLDYGRSTTLYPGSVTLDRSSISYVSFTRFGWEFVQACRAPRRSASRLWSA